MARVFQQRYTIRDPKTGESVIDSKTGKPKVGKTRCWYIEYKSYGGTRQVVKGSKDKFASKQLAAKLELDAWRAENGLEEKFREQIKVPLSNHLIAFRDFLLAGGTDMTYQRAKTVLDESKILLWPDVQPSLILNAISRLTREVTEKIEIKGGGRKKYERRKVIVPLSIQSKNFYLKALKQFF
ncbi:MAG TPA: hypothetical protein PKB02_10705, partial [Anaerohalosphaeraceae bacterium]|nr:hypothetical protein [Anaerohalosphaeraceae bacterium]